MLPEPDNTVSALLLLFIGFIQLLVVVGLIVLAYVGISRGFGRGVEAWRAADRRRSEAKRTVDRSGSNE